MKTFLLLMYLIIYLGLNNSCAQDYEKIKNRADSLFSLCEFSAANILYKGIIKTDSLDQSLFFRYAVCLSKMNTSNDSVLFYIKKAICLGYDSPYLLYIASFERLHVYPAWDTIINKIKNKYFIEYPETANNYGWKMRLLYFEDQRYREMLDGNPYYSNFNCKVLSYATQDSLYKLIRKADSLNAIVFDSLVSLYGFPDKKLAGNGPCNAALLIIEHVGHYNTNRLEFLEKHLNAAKEASEKGNIPRWDYAQMVDRILVYKNKKQRYGTQYYKNTTTNKTELWPIKNKRRLEMRKKKLKMEW